MLRTLTNCSFSTLKELKWVQSMSASEAMVWVSIIAASHPHGGRKNNHLEHK